MGFLDSLKTWFRSETAEAKDLIDETQGRLASDLDRREAELGATPAERLEQLQTQISDGDQGFDELRDKIEGRTARADAVEELAADESHDHESPPEPVRDEGDGGQGAPEPDEG